MARAPVPGKCKTRLLAAHSPSWVAGLYAAMLRDTLDGLSSVTADDYLVFAAPLSTDEGEEPAPHVLQRHVPAAWEIIPQQGEDLGARMEHALGVMFSRGATYALLSGTDAPSVPTAPIEALLRDETQRDRVTLGPSEDGGYYLIGLPRLEVTLLRDMPWSTPAVMETTRRRCEDAGLAVALLPKWYDVDEPGDVLRLIDELREHPERAPRTAQLLVSGAPG